MKKKSFTYILVTVALGIWAYVFYSIFSVVTGNDSVVLKKTAIVQSPDSSSQIKNGYTLLANYPDPFLKSGKAAYTSVYTGESGYTGATGKAKPIRQSVQIKNQKQIEKDQQNAANKIFCQTISYSGLIRNKRSNKNVAILEIENKEYMLSAGENANGITLLKILSDSVEVMCREHKMFIRKGK